VYYSTLSEHFLRHEQRTIEMSDQIVTFLKRSVSLISRHGALARALYHSGAPFGIKTGASDESRNKFLNDRSKDVRTL